MTPLMLIAAVVTVGGFSYDTVTLSERTKPVSSAPQGYPATWEEHVEAIAGTSPSDREFNALMKRQAIELQRQYYQDDADGAQSFASYDVAGSVDVSQSVIAASPEIVSMVTGASFYQAGMAHPNGEGGSNLTWSRKLRRMLTEKDVFARPPDRALRRLALAHFENRDALENPDDPSGLPLAWDQANICRDGITWKFLPYQLGGYLSGGSTTIRWAALKPYLRRTLPFSITAIRDKPNRP